MPEPKLTRLYPWCDAHLARRDVVQVATEHAVLALRVDPVQVALQHQPYSSLNT